MFKLLFKLLSSGSRLPVLIYHQVLPEPDAMRPFEIDKNQFELQMSWVARYFNPVALHEGYNQLIQGELKPGSIAVTFDDGYANNFTVAAPIMKKYGVPGTFFIASDFLDGGIMWNDAILEYIRLSPSGKLDLNKFGLGDYVIPDSEDRFDIALKILDQLKHRPFEERRDAVNEIVSACKLPTDLMMTSLMLKELASEPMFEIGGHTKSHPILTRMDSKAAEIQIVENKCYLESLLDEPIRCFAYPNGKPEVDYDSGIMGIVKAAGYELAVSTSPGVAGRHCQSFQIPRYTPWRRTEIPFLVQMARNYFNAVSEVA